MSNDPTKENGVKLNPMKCESLTISFPDYGQRVIVAAVAWNKAEIADKRDRRTKLIKAIREYEEFVEFYRKIAEEAEKQNRGI